jgi:hypothetical protein
MTWFEANQKAVTGPLCIDLLRNTFKSLKHLREHALAPALVTSKAVADLIEYYGKAEVVWETTGYRKLRGPDGHKWIEHKAHYTGIGYGGGHKALRRQGKRPFDEYEWRLEARP